MNTPHPYLLISGNPAITQVFARLLARKLDAGCVSSGHHSLRVNPSRDVAYQENLRRAWEEAWVTGKTLVVDLGSNLQQQLPVVRSLVRKSANKSLWIKLEACSKEGANCLFLKCAKATTLQDPYPAYVLTRSIPAWKSCSKKQWTLSDNPPPVNLGASG